MLSEHLVANLVERAVTDMYACGSSLECWAVVAHSASDRQWINESGLEETAYATRLLRDFIAQQPQFFRFYFPMVPAYRVTAELKGAEKCTKKVPTTPITLPILIALVAFVRVRLGARSAELLRIKGVDVLLRTSHTNTTTIRLGKTKNNR